MLHINDQTSTDGPIAPFGGVGLSGNGYRIGGQKANLEAFAEIQWVMVNQEPASYPFLPHQTSPVPSGVDIEHGRTPTRHSNSRDRATCQAPTGTTVAQEPELRPETVKQLTGTPMVKHEPEVHTRIRVRCQVPVPA